MPYSSDSQRRFFHTDTAKKKGITDKEVNEFDKASKGMKLPEKAPKMYAGGETNPKNETLFAMQNNPSAGFADGGVVPSTGTATLGSENPILNYIMSKLIQNKAPIMKDQQEAIDINNLDNIGGVQPPKIDTSDGKFLGEFNVNASTQLQHMADGGDVSPYPTGDEPLPWPIDLNNTGPLPINLNPIQPPSQTPNPPPTPSPAPYTQGPSLQDVSQKINSTPDTDPNIYQGISAEDRANLYKQLLAQKASGGNLAASGIAGFGDAIARSFGHENTNYQQGVEQKQNQNVANQIGTVDTERTQKLQDIQANAEESLNDPKSAISQAMRQTFINAGIQIPSGMSGALMLKVAPDIGNLALKQAVLQQTGALKRAEIGQKGLQIQTQAAENAVAHPVQALANRMTGGSAFPALNQVERTGGLDTPLSTQDHPMVGQDFNGSKITGVRQVK